MAMVTPERVRLDLERLVHLGTDVRDFSARAARILMRQVGADGFCMVTLDPATLLPTGEVVENGLPTAAMARMAEIEIRDGDVNSFAALARAGKTAASLSEATEGDLSRSRRHRELRRPSGFGDELRVVLTSDRTTWGALTLSRAADGAAFAAEETMFVASLADLLAEGLRRAILFGTSTTPQKANHSQVGLALVGPDNSITAANEAAAEWLAELRGDNPEATLPPAVATVANRALTRTGRGTPPGCLARARVLTPSGHWLLVRATNLEDGGDIRTAVIIESLRPYELAPLIADAYGLTDRECAVIQLVAQGAPTNTIAKRLHLSPWTVQDHLKSIFGKLGVGTRGELVARIFFEHYAPHLADGPLGASDGWDAPL